MEVKSSEGQKAVKLKDIGKIETGSTPSKAIVEYYGNDYPFFKPTDLNQGINTKTASDNLSKLGFDKTRKLPRNSVLVTCIGATIGKTGLIKVEGASNQQINAVIPNQQHNPKYIFYQIISHSFQNQIINNASSTTLPILNKSKFEQLNFITTDLFHQNSVVEKIEELFSELDKGIENLKTAQQQLKVYRQAVLKWAFEGKLTNDYVKDGELPEGWRWVELGDVVTKKTVKALPVDMPEARFIGMDCIQAHSLKPHFTYQFSEFKSAGNYFEKDQVLYGRMRPYLNKVYKAEFNGACSGEFIILECKPNFIADLLKYILHAREFVSFANHKTAGDRPRISFDEIADYPIALCKPDEQLKIVQEIESRLSVCDKMEETIIASLQQAEALRQSILKRAFEGKLVKVTNSPKEATVISLSSQRDDWQRKVLAAWIIFACHKDRFFGRTKFQKTLYLCEQHAKLDFDSHYLKKAAGPLDAAFVYPFIKEAEAKNWFVEEEDSPPYYFEPLEGIGELTTSYPQFFKPVADKITFVIKLLQSKNTDESELIATIYAIWNNYIIDNKWLTDERLIEEVYDWSESKAKFKKPVILSTWRWMKGEGLIPVGFGKLVNEVA